MGKPRFRERHIWYIFKRPTVTSYFRDSDSMASWKKSKKLYKRPYIVDWPIVSDIILNGEKSHWSWFEETFHVHHTGIVFFIDYEARYTVNWTPQTGTKLGSLAFETEGQLVFEDEIAKLSGDTHYPVEYKPFIQEYDILGILHSEDNEKWNEFAELIKKLSSFKFEKYENKDDEGNARLYDLTGCNCRDHVESVLRDVLSVDDPHLIKALSDIQEVRKRPAELLLYDAAAFGGRFVNALRKAGQWSPWDNIRAREKREAKINGPFLDLSSCFSFE